MLWRRWRLKWNRRLRRRSQEGRLAAALENPQETDSDRLSSLGSALAALAAKMEPQAAAEIAKGLAAALENPQETDSDRLSSLGSALAALAAKMEPQAAAEIAKSLAAALENPQETDSTVFRALAVHWQRWRLKWNRRLRRRSQTRCALATALENLQETDSDHLSILGSALAALAEKMEPRPATEIAKGLAAALDNPQGMDFDRLSALGITLAVFSASLPSAHHTHLLALSNLLLTPGRNGG